MVGGRALGGGVLVGSKWCFVTLWVGILDLAQFPRPLGCSVLNEQAKFLRTWSFRERQNKRGRRG